MHIDEPKLSENYFIRFWNFFAGIAFNVAPVKADFVKQEDIVAHFLQRGHQNAEDLVRSILKSRQYGSEIEIVQFYCLYPLMHDTMCGKRRKTTVSVWSEEGEIDMLRLVSSPTDYKLQVIENGLKPNKVYSCHFSIAGVNTKKSMRDERSKNISIKSRVKTARKPSYLLKS